MDGECQADLRIVFDNNAAEELRGFDMCRNAAITLRPGEERIVARRLKQELQAV
jgi:hypothetical protein